MKRIVTEVQGDGLDKLLGELVMLWCMNYIYSGKLVGVNDKDVVLNNACVVYETGHNSKGDTWTRAEALPEGDWFVRTSSIESYGITKKVVKS